MKKYVVRRCTVDPASCTGAPAATFANDDAEGKVAEAKRIANNICYLKSAFQVITYLVSQRHNQEFQDDFAKDMFNSFYQRALGEDKSLTDIRGLLPPEAQYTSRDFQTAVVRTLAQMVLNKVWTKYRESDSESFCMKGCIRRNRDQGEILSLAIRFLSAAKPEEYLIGHLQLERSDADYIADRILRYLTGHRLNPKYIVSQCYDGGTLFSGCSGGVHIALQRRLNQRIPNIHCDHWPLSLALIHAIQDVPSIESFLSTCEMVDNFLLHPHIIQINDRFSRPDRTPFSDPSGYYHLLQNIVLNFKSVRGFFTDLPTDGRVPEELRKNAAELLPVLQERYFYATGKFVMDLITATELTELRFVGLLRGAPYIKYLPFEAEMTQAALTSLTSLRSEPESLAEFYTGAENLALSDNSSGEPEPKRRKIEEASVDEPLAYEEPRTPTMAEPLAYEEPCTPTKAEPSAYEESCSHSMADSLPTAFDTPESSDRSESESNSSDTESTNEDNREFNPVDQKVFGTILSKVLEQAIHGMERRLPPEDQLLLEAIYVLFPSSDHFLDFDICMPLVNITRVCRIALAKQIQVAKPLLSREILSSMDLAEACEVVYKHSATFPELYEVYAAAVLMSIPLSDCERSFPVHAQSTALSEHDLNVAIVAREQAITSSLCVDEFVAVFSRNGTRLLL